MTSEAAPIAGREYRQSKILLEAGVLFILLFGLLGILCVTTALLNSDGSFRHPIAFAIVFGVICSCGILPGVWAVRFYAHHRLIVDPTSVSVTSCFATRQIYLTNVTHAVWKSLFTGGALVLKAHDNEMKIRLGDYTYQERRELIEFFREALTGRDQDGWERFESRCMPPNVDYNELRKQMRGHLRFAVIAWAIAIPFMYAILIWTKLVDGLPNGNWFFVAVFPLIASGLMTGGMWITARADLARARTRPDPQGDQKAPSGAPKC